MSPVELSKAELHVEKGEASKHQHCEVGDEEGPFIELGGLIWNTKPRRNKDFQIFSPPPLA